MRSVRSKSRQGSSPSKARGRAVSRRQSGQRSPRGDRALLLGVVLAAATLALYYPALSHPFTNFDDDLYVFGNSHVKSGLHLETVAWAATTLEACNWHPLTWLSHALDCQLFGLDPSGQHGTNLLLHVLNVLLLYAVLRRATGAIAPSFAVAALFALHPINVESVAWIAERKNLLSTFFFLLALGAYDWYARAPRISRYGVVALLFALALMAKPQVITFPFVLLLWDYWPLRRMFAEDQQRDGAARILARPWTFLAGEKVPLFAMSAASAVITVKAQQACGAMRAYPFVIRAENAAVAYALYVKKAFWPSQLAVIYPHSEDRLGTWPVLASFAFLLAVTAFVIKERRRRYLFVGWFWFLGTLVPMIGLVQVGWQAMADRYAYLSFLGLFVMVCWGVREWVAVHHMSIRWTAGATAVVLLALAVVAHHQLEYWSDNITLWEHTLRITSNNWRAEDNLGGALLAVNRQDDAIVHFRRSADIYPADPVSHTDIGYYEQQQGNVTGALAEYNKVLTLVRKQEQGAAAEAHNNMGFIYLRLKDYSQAKENFQAAVNLNPQHNRAWIGLGVTAQKAGDIGEATQDYSRSIQAEPSDLGYLLLAQGLTLQGLTMEAQKATQQAHAISPNFEGAQRTALALVAK